MCLDDWIADRIRHRATRGGHPGGHTWLFPEVPEEARETLLHMAATRQIGTPVLVMMDPPDRWTLLGTRKILSMDRGRFSRFELARLRDIDPQNRDVKPGELERLRLRGTWPWERAIIWGPQGNEIYTWWNMLQMFPFRKLPPGWTGRRVHQTGDAGGSIG